MRLLDTNIVGYWMRGEQHIISRLRRWRPCDLAISAITLAEILYGIEKSPVRKKQRRDKMNRICNQLDIFEFDQSAARYYAPVRSNLEKKGTPVSERDLQIAAIALSQGLCVVTHNVSGFSRVPGLTVEDWATG